MRRIVYAAFALTVLAACQPTTTELTEEQKAEIAAEVTMRLDAFWNDLEQPNLDRWLTYMHESPDILSVSNGSFVEGYASVDSLYRPAVANWEGQVLTESATRVVVLSQDFVYTMRVGTDSVTLTSGEGSPTRPWAVTNVWVRRDGEWRILLGHGSHPSPVNQ